jgi:hypothetical protein
VLQKTLLASFFRGGLFLRIIAELDENKQAYLLGYVYCSQLDEARQVRFYIDTGSTVTTLLDIDTVRLGLKWRDLKQTKCDTAVGPAYPFVLPSATILLKSTEDGKVTLNPFSLEIIHLLPPDDPTTVMPVQYEFPFSLLGMDVLAKFKTLTFNFVEKKLILET